MVWVLNDFDSSAFAAFKVDVLQRGKSRPWDALSQAQNSLQSFAVMIWGVSMPHWDSLSRYTFYGPSIERFQDCWWDPEFPQLSQMVKSLPGFLNLCLNVCSPSQVLWDFIRYLKLLTLSTGVSLIIRIQLSVCVCMLQCLCSENRTKLSSL